MPSRKAPTPDHRRRDSVQPCAPDRRLAAKLGLGCVALLENPLGTDDANYLGNGNRLLLDLFDAKVELVENLDNADEQLHALAARLRSNGKNRIWCRLAAPMRWVPWVMCVPGWNWRNRSRTPA
jgi:hypothetical protein